ncbi:MAG: hypothetical protein ACK5P7_02480 [Bdellovibrio sp.]
MARYFLIFSFFLYFYMAMPASAEALSVKDLHGLYEYSCFNGFNHVCSKETLLAREQMSINIFSPSPCGNDKAIVFSNGHYFFSTTTGAGLSEGLLCARLNLYSIREYEDRIEVIFEALFRLNEGPNYPFINKSVKTTIVKDSSGIFRVTQNSGYYCAKEIPPSRCYQGLVSSNSKFSAAWKR